MCFVRDDTANEKAGSDFKAGKSGKTGATRIGGWLTDEKGRKTKRK
jgi:hypothetical protein